MPSKKYTEIAGHSDEQLATELENAERDYQQLRFDHYTRGIENVAQISVLRRDIARIKTEQSVRANAAANGGAGKTRKLTRRARLQAKQA